VATIHFNVYKVSVASGTINTYTFLFHFSGTTDYYNAGGAEMEETITVSPDPSQVSFDDSEKYLYVEVFGIVTTGCSESTANRRRRNFDIGNTSTPACTTNNCNMTSPTVSIPEEVILYISLAPFIPMVVLWFKKRKERLAFSG